MASILGSMGEVLNQLALVMSELLVVDVSVVDIDLIRVAGTGIYEDTVGQSVDLEGNILKQVIQTGEKLIIDNPRENAVCLTCPHREDCRETFEMTAPIILDNQVIGVVGFVCFSKSQRDYLLGKYDALNDFLDHVSALIASKATMVIENQQNLAVLDLLTQIMNRVDEGVLVVDSDGVPTSFNTQAQQILKMDAASLQSSKFNITATDNQILDYDEFLLSTETMDLLVAGKYQHSYKSIYPDILIFKDIRSIKASLIDSSTTSEINTLSNIVGSSSHMKSLKEKVQIVAQSTSTVLVTGESGTGKELFARAIHEKSDRMNAPFVAINCAAIPEHLLESELFGYVRGAFTGADPKGKIGKFELADKGTLFLDEIGDMPLYIQVKLLRALEEREIMKLGSNHATKIDVRIVAATHRNLEEMIELGTFRKDLFYRLNVIPIELPSLREREDDLMELTFHFIKKYSELFDKKVQSIDDAYLDQIRSYSWPGNIRELQNTVEYSINMLQPPFTLTKDHLPVRVHKRTESKPTAITNYNLNQMEKKMIEACLKKYGHKKEGKKIAAEKLGISPATLYRKIKEYKIQ